MNEIWNQKNRKTKSIALKPFFPNSMFQLPLPQRPYQIVSIIKIPNQLQDSRPESENDANGESPTPPRWRFSPTAA